MRHRAGNYRLLSGSRGQTMTEYALILVTIAVIAAALVHTAGINILGLVDEVKLLLGG